MRRQIIRPAPPVRKRARQTEDEPPGKWFQICMLSIIMIIPLCIAGSIMLHFYKISDVQGVQVQTGIAKVIDVQPMNSKYGYNSPRFVVDFDGTMLSFRDAKNPGLLRVGDYVKITYRVGKSGRIYLDEMEPALEERKGLRMMRSK